MWSGAQGHDLLERFWSISTYTTVEDGRTIEAKGILDIGNSKIQKQGIQKGELMIEKAK